MNTLISFGLLVSVAVAYGASLPAPDVQPQLTHVADAPEQVVERLEPQESRGWNHGGGGWNHGGGGWNHGGGGWNHGGGGWNHGGGGWGHGGGWHHG